MCAAQHFHMLMSVNLQLSAMLTDQDCHTMYGGIPHLLVAELM
jgi:hypothetical protein